jgi:L-rhamnose mutarotase
MSTRLKYDYDMLKSICDEGCVTLLENYNDKYITRDTRIIGKCILCENSFNKSLNKLHKQRNFGCLTCAKSIKFDKIKDTMLEKYGVEYAAQSEVFLDKMKATTLEKYGVEHGTQCDIVKNKIRATNNEKYGCDYGLQNKIVKEKKRQTYLKKYGVENPLQCKDIMDKLKNTNLEKYGVEHVFQCPEIKEKVKQKNIEKYGFEYGFQSQEIKDKIKKNNLEKYGVEHNTQRKEVIEKTKKHNLEKYGVEYVMQCPEIMEKNVKMSYYLKEYTMPSGKTIKIQGYEHFALDELLQHNIHENDILTGCKNVPEIWYHDENGKKRRHFVDIFIPSQNKCIEIKSTWTFQKQKNIVFLKQNAGKELGYSYELWVYDNKGNKVEFYN